MTQQEIQKSIFDCETMLMLANLKLSKAIKQEDQKKILDILRKIDKLNEHIDQMKALQENVELEFVNS